MKNIAVLMTCHNRKGVTLACLKALFDCTLPSGLSIHVILVDDGSTDGTAEAIERLYPHVTLLFGDGNLFWNRGMRVAFEYAINSARFDGYLWLNDDTMLSPDAISDVVALAQSQDNSVAVVGAICDPVTGERTYGGSKQMSPTFRPFLCRSAHPNGKPQDVDVVNGNLLLLPGNIVRYVGNLDPIFEHAMGDIDYSFRLRKRGVRIVMTRGFIGNCSKNSKSGTHQDRGISVRQRMAYAFSRKGLPFRSWFTLCYRHGGIIWPIYFLWAYVKIVAGRA